MLSSISLSQAPKNSKVSKGPRALALLQISPTGKATLVPIAILINGDYFDAGAYKADPVPMALWGGTVYEGIRTGVSQGLFTVKGVLEQPDTHQWKAEGTWQTTEMLKSKPHKEQVANEPRGMNDDSGPPVLRHYGSAKPKPPETPPPAPATTSTPSEPKPASVPPSPAAPPTPQQPAAPAPSTVDRAEMQGPVLKRGKPAPTEPEPEVAPTQPPKTGAAPKSSSPAVQLIPAISDAGGPDPRPYKYNMTSAEEQQFRSKMLAFAATEVNNRARELEAGTIGQPAPKPSTQAKKKTAAGPQPHFENVEFHVFDLVNSNEPVLVLTAQADLPSSQTRTSDNQFLVSIVYNQDVNGDFHKVLSNVTDTRHLDVLPNYEFIDAVDVDGDGRGELLFRKNSDTGSAFVIYRVIGSQLYALFQGTL